MERVTQSDSLVAYLETTGEVKSGSEMYYVARLSTKMKPFLANNTTFSEMEHSGNFRLISKESVSKELIKIQKIAQSYQELSGLEEQEAQMTYPLLGFLFDSKVFVTMAKHSVRAKIDSAKSAFADIERPEGNPQLRSHNPDKINQLIFDLHERRGSFNGEVGILKELKKEEIKLIHLINQEYALND
ncbi:MAG: hypothetical protein KGK14_00250 [Bacteroidota bacterium]|nr:hypothetical protein [Bacteroidota bacterium]